MNIFKSKISLKITVFATILLVCFWMIPSGMVFGEGEEGGVTVVETTAPETTAPETTAPETTAPETTAPETTASETTAEETTAPDIIAPVISLIGDAVVNINVGDSYTEAGATASDDVDGDISANIVTGGAVDTSIAGSYEMTYNVSDAAGNVANEVLRTVNVAEIQDTTRPVINLNGNTVINLHIGNTFTDPGATATDDRDENVTVVITGIVDSNAIGSYIISYDAIDVAGNAAVTVTRTVNVYSEAVINTDKPDYLPSDYVLVTGSGWLPGETVRLDFTETLLDPIMQQTITYYTIADSEGNVSDIQYLIELRHLGASFILTATGQTSGLTARTTFTDGTVIIRVTKITKDFNGNVVTNDPTVFTIRLMQGVYPVGLQIGSELTISGIPGSNVVSFPGASSVLFTRFWVKEDANPNYSVIISPQNTNATSGTVNITITNQLTTPTTVSIKKEVYEADGTTIDADNADSFTVELWTANFLGGPDTYKATATIVGNNTSAPIPVVPGVAYVVRETSINPNYTTSYSPVSILYPNDVSGTLTPSTGSSDKVFTAKSTKRGNTFTVIKTGLKSSNDISDFFYDRAKFTLYNPSGVIVKTSTGADSITLDNSDSLLSIYSDTYTWEKLADGTGYKLVESYDFTPANKFIYNSSLSGNEYTFNINGSNESKTVNNAAAGSIRAYKQDNYGTAFAGAEIGLYDTQPGPNQADPQPLQTVFSTGVSPDPNVLFANVASGGQGGITYYIHEVNSLPGYAPDTGWYPVTINDTDLNPVLGTTIVNTPSGIITLHKVDNNRNPLEGAEFGLYLAQDATTAPLTAVSSDAAGLVTFEHLGYKTYYIREIKAPFGFLLDENWYTVTLTPENTPYDIETPIIDMPGGTITVTKNVIAPDGKTDVTDVKEFAITLEKKDESGNWVPVKSTTIKEGSPVVFSVPLNICYRVVETADAKYTEMSTACEVTLSVAGQNQDVLITNRQHYAVILMGKIIFQWNNSILPTLITDDDHIFFAKVEGSYTPFLEYHPIATKLPTVFLVWPGTYTVVEKTDVNYNDNGQPIVISGFDISDFNLADLGDLTGLANILLSNALGGGLTPEIKVEGGDIAPLIIANKYTPQYGTVTVTKDVVKPDGCTPVEDGKEFSVKLQRLNLTLPNILDFLNLGNVGNIANLSDLVNILDLTQLGSLSNLVGWEDVGTPKTVSEGNPVTFTGVEKDHLYRVVETQAPGYMQIRGILPFYFEPDVANKQVDVVNKQELVFVKVSKDVIGADGLPVADCNWFTINLDGSPTQTFPHLINEKVDALFAVMPGTYTLTECPQACYDRVDKIGTITLNPGDGPLCDPIELTVINKQKPGKINITKNGLMPGDSAIFTLCDKDGNPIAGKSTITLSEGQSGSWEDLNWGCYTVEESYPTANNYTYATTTYSPTGPVTIGCSSCKTGDLTRNITITNSDEQIKTAKIVVIKYVYGALLAGENFSFTNSQGPGFTLDGTETPTWQEAIVVQAGKTYTIAENDPGEYWTTMLDSTLPIAATTFGAARDITFTVTGDNIASIDGKIISFYNTRKTCEVIIDKTIDGEPATEGTFNFSGLGNFSLSGSNSYNRPVILACGVEFTVSEDSMSPGYVFNDIAVSPGSGIEVISQTGSSITFKLHCNSTAEKSISNGNPIEVRNTITFDNTKVPGIINLHKTDAFSGANLEGAIFRLFLMDETTQAMDFEGDDLVPDVTTDADGLGSFANLAWGSYIVREINPPAGYEPREAEVTIDGSNLIINLESEIADPRIPGQLRLQKVSSTNALQAVAGATYEVRDSGGNLVAVLTTAADGWATVSLPWGTYSVKETIAPAGYDLDPATYSVTIGAASTSVWLYVKDIPTGGGGGGTLTVAGLTEGGIQVLAFTGIDPIVPIAGGSAVIAGLAILIASLKRRAIRK